MRRSIAIPLAATSVIGVAVGLGAYTFIYAKGYSYLTNDPAACTNCHVMRAQYDAWMKSSHHSVHDRLRHVRELDGLACSAGGDKNSGDANNLCSLGQLSLDGRPSPSHSRRTCRAWPRRADSRTKVISSSGMDLRETLV